MNKVILMGRLAKDPEIRYTQGAEPICVSRFTLAVDRRFKKEGEPDADFIFCITFRRTAEFMERYIKKGMQISLCG
ncbi:MAG: single-stranded DNA-binding protein, partial [Defluviitaleaceae bacterium]|nr:single-stranded DNA-binding protein [Defluviitaleaceae bacterium]